MRGFISQTRCFAAAIALLTLHCAQLKAQERRTAYLPMIFQTESRELQTSACLQVNESVYSQTGWWQDAAGSAAAPERAFKAVIAAIQHKDRVALFRLTSPTQRQDTKKFEEQATAFFQQFEMLEIVGVPRAYEFDNLAVFFARLRAQQMIAYVPFVFALQEDGSFGFLPLRSQKAAFNIVNDWFASAIGPGKSTQPTYCTDDDVKRATYRVSLSPAQAGHAGTASSLLLKGVSLDAPGDSAALVARVKARFEEMKVALGKSGIDDFAKNLTPEGAMRLREWFTSASEAERSVYKTAIREQQPFFLFDLTSVMVLYTRSITGEVQVMYFTFTPDHELVWTNSSHLTVADQVFKQGPMHDAAAMEKPFSSMVNK